MLVLAADSERDMFDAMMAAGRKMSDPFEIAVNFTVATGAAPLFLKQQIGAAPPQRKPSEKATRPPS